MSETGLDIVIAGTESKKGCKLILKGYLDAETVPKLNAKMKDVIQQKTSKIILDLQEISFISSAGWGALVILAKTAQREKGNIVLINLGPKLARTFNLLDLSPILQVFSSEADASAFLNK